MNCNEPLIINTKPVDEPFDQAKLVELYNTIGKLEATIDDLNADLGGCEAHIEELEEILTGVKKVLNPVYSQTLVSRAETIMRQRDQLYAHIKKLEAKLSKMSNSSDTEERDPWDEPEYLHERISQLKHSNTTFVASVDRHSSEIQEACEECEKFGSSAANGLAFAITNMGLWIVSGRTENAKLKHERDRYSDAIFTATARMKAALSDEYTSEGVNRSDVLCDGFEGAEVLEVVERLKMRCDMWQRTAWACQKANAELAESYRAKRVRNVLRRMLGRVLGGGR